MRQWVRLKYALVDFFQRDEVEIVDTKDTRVQAECGGMEWTTQVPVISFSDGPTGKKPPKKYIAKVLRFEGMCMYTLAT